MVVSTHRLDPLLGDVGDVAEPIRGTFISPAHSGFLIAVPLQVGASALSVTRRKGWRKMTTLKNLIDTLGPVKKADKTPTSRKLREEAGDPILTTEAILIYACGYAVYENESGKTVMWVPGCTSFTYYFGKLTEAERKYMNQTDALPEGMLEEMPWDLALTLIGDHRIEANRMNSAVGSRKGTIDLDTFLYGDKDGDAEEMRERSYRKDYEWREDQVGEDPETIYIRKESREEALASMTARQREVFVLYYNQGYKQKEIADMLGIAQQRVSKHLDKALVKMKKIRIDTMLCL